MTKFSVLTIVVVAIGTTIFTGCNTEDLTTPTIVLEGDSPYYIVLGETWEEPGYTATVNEDGDITANVKVDSSAINLNEIGEYEVSYTVTDEAGNTGVETRIVRVVVGSANYLGSYQVNEICDIDGDGVLGEADVEAALTECRADRGGGVGFACRNLQLDEADDLLCHVYPSIRSPMNLDSSSANARDWLPGLLMPMSRHRQQRARWTRALRHGRALAELSILSSDLLDLREVQLHRSCAAEDRHRDANLRLLVVDVLNRTVEIGERAVLDSNQLTDRPQGLGLRLLDALLHLVNDLHHLGFGNRRWPVLRTADESGDLVRVLDQVPAVVSHLHLDQHIARKEAALRHGFLAVLQLDHFLHRHQDAAELVLQLGTVDSLAKVALNRLLHAGIGVNNIPALVRWHSGRNRSGPFPGCQDGIDRRTSFCADGFFVHGVILNASNPTAGRRKPIPGSCRSTTRTRP